MELSKTVSTVSLFRGLPQPAPQATSRSCRCIRILESGCT